MRRFIATLVATVAGLVLLLSFKISSPAKPTALTPATTGSSPDAAATPATTTVTGSAVSVGERGQLFGTVQVRVTLVDGKITTVAEVQTPQNDPRSSQISQFSIPVLRQEALTAQGASIDVVSGATYTSQAYATSLQAALDKAK